MDYLDTLPLPVLPTGSVFEWGGIRQLAAMARSLGMRRPLLVTDRGLADVDFVTRVIEDLRRSVMEPGLFADVDGNPRIDQVTCGAGVLAAGGHDGVIALGGGSGLDAGKAIAFAAAQRRPLEDFAFNRHGPGGPPDCEMPWPWVAVPTTAGTGSEVSPSAVVTDASGAKRSIMHPAMFAPRVVCDPELTTGLPRALTAWTGVDALTHCLEAFCAPGDDPEADDWALAGMARVHRALLRACSDGTDRAARGDMMAAAVLGARAFRKGLGGLHGLSHALAARFGGQHGQINAVLLPFVIEANRPAIDGRLEAIANALDLGETPGAVVAWIDGLLDRLDLPRSLPDIGIEWPASMLPDLCAASAAEPNAATNPVVADADWARGVLEVATEQAGDRETRHISA
ncbi:MAG: iron-containing alcohol dehydrogenase [Halofilum sp. (in: g-proteobacteria)]|nr:iron-containing alcohol dehydrogenase [Halofilum sp. (in: g-proteobacteria)]